MDAQLQIKRQNGIAAGNKIKTANRDLEVLIKDISQTVTNLGNMTRSNDDPLIPVITSLGEIKGSKIPNLNSKLKTLGNSVSGYSQYIYR